MDYVWITYPVQIWHPVQNLCDTAPRVGPFSFLVARPYSFLDVGLDFQAKPASIYIIKMTQ
jgi:hypothetical protein